MKDFNFNSYKSLLRYSMVENRKTYLTSFGIGILIVALFVLFFDYMLTRNFSSIDYSIINVQDNINAGSIVATVLFGCVMMLVVTQMEVSNRFCIAREGSQYCLLPASYREKGWTILTVFFLVWFIGTIAFYLIIYSLLSAYYTVVGGQFEFEPDFIVPDVEVMLGSDYGEPDYYTVSTFVKLLLGFTPVSLVISLLVHLILVTFFKKKSQLKAIATTIVAENILSYALVFVISSVAMLPGVDDWCHDHFNGILYSLDALIILQLPLMLLLGWWFFRRLRYKEVK